MTRALLLLLLAGCTASAPSGPPTHTAEGRPLWPWERGFRWVIRDRVAHHTYTSWEEPRTVEEGGASWVVFEWTETESQYRLPAADVQIEEYYPALWRRR